MNDKQFSESIINTPPPEPMFGDFESVVETFIKVAKSEPSQGEFTEYVANIVKPSHVSYEELYKALIKVARDNLGLPKEFVERPAYNKQG